MTPEQHEWLLALDPTTAMPSAEGDALIADKVMGWIAQYRRQGCCPEYTQPGAIVGWLDNEDHYHSAIQGSASYWSPSTNPAHALEALLKAERWSVTKDDDGVVVAINAGDGCGWFCGRVEAGGNPAADVALATYRALLAMLQAGEGE